MAVPFATTNIRVQRWSITQPGTLNTLVFNAPAIIGRSKGRESYDYRGTAVSGWNEQLDAKLNSDETTANYSDIVTDLGTGTRYRVIWSEFRQGFGLDHLEAGLSLYAPTSTYSLFRNTTTNEFGDVLPSNGSYPASGAAWKGVEGTVREVQSDTQLPTSQQPGTARNLQGRFPVGLDIRPGDIIRDDVTFVTYSVVTKGFVSDQTSADIGVELLKNTV